MHRLTRLALVPLLLATFGCGGLIDDKYAGQTLATVQGQLKASSGTNVTAPIGMAIFWEGATVPAVPITSGGDPSEPLSCAATRQPRDTSFVTNYSSFVSQAVSYEPHFPIDFSIPVKGVPPKSAQFDLAAMGGGTGVVAFGLVIAFEDANGNGAYDFGTPTRNAERILGTSATNDSHTTVVFLDGHLNGRAAAIPGLPADFDTQGLTLVRLDQATNTFTSEPASTPITVAVAPNTATNELGCSSVGIDTFYEATPREGAIITCMNSTSYTWELAERPTTCMQKVHTGIVCLGNSAPPANWPCH